MKFSVRHYDAQHDAIQWDALCADAPMATMLHTRRFLSYHGKRFEDCSCVIHDDAGRLRAVFPAARIDTSVISHPGATYGGLVHAGNLLGDDLLQALAALTSHYASCGFRLLRYKAVPHIYQRWPAQDDLYALFRLDARRYRCDISSAINLRARRPLPKRRARGLSKARAAEVRIEMDSSNTSGFWRILQDNLQRRHDATPVHTIEEIRQLMQLFPEDITLVTGHLGNEIAAGVLLFDSACVSHAQYIASTPAGQERAALDAVFDACIVRASKIGKTCFDFGISTEQEGRYLNEGLYRFKSEFGGGGIAHEFYEIELGTDTPSATA